MINIILMIMMIIPGLDLLKHNSFKRVTYEEGNHENYSRRLTPVQKDLYNTEGTNIFLKLEASTKLLRVKKTLWKANQ